MDEIQHFINIVAFMVNFSVLIRFLHGPSHCRVDGFSRGCFDASGGTFDTWGGKGQKRPQWGFKPQTQFKLKDVFTSSHCTKTWPKISWIEKLPSCANDLRDWEAGVLKSITACHQEALEMFWPHLIQIITPVEEVTQGTMWPIKHFQWKF